MAAKKRKSPQLKVTIPDAEWPDIYAAMEYDGIKKFSQFALAAIRQRVRRTLVEKAAAEAAKSKTKS